MKKISKDIKADVISPIQKKRLMKINRFLASKYVLLVVACIVATGLFFVCNYLLNFFCNLSSLVKDYSNPALYVGWRNFFALQPDSEIIYLLIFLFIVFVDVLLIYKIRTAYKDLNIQQKGAERWTTLAEIKEQYRAVPEKGKEFKGKGGVPICRYENKIYIDDSPVNTIVIGITRSGKGETYTFPTIDIYSRAEEKPSMIITDPKLDEYPTCYETLTKRGYDVYLFNLNEPLRGMGYNPLQLAIDEYKEGRISEAEQVCQSFCYAIFHTKASANTKEPFFPDGSTNILFCLCWSLLVDGLEKDQIINAHDSSIWTTKQEAFEKLEEKDKAAVRKKIKTLNNKNLRKRLLDFRYIPPEYEYMPTTENEKTINIPSAIDLFNALNGVKVPRGEETITALEVYFSMRPENDKARLRFSSIASASSNQKGNLYQYMAQQINHYTLDNVKRLTCHNTLKISDIGFGSKPVAVFLTVPDYDDSLHTLATTFIDQVYFALSKQAGRSKNKKCDREVLFYLEEVGNMPEIKNLKAGITMGLGRGFRFVLSIQAYSQLEEIYGEKGAETIIGNCGNQVYIMTDDSKTAERFSKLIGNETITNVSRMGGKLSLNKTYTESYDSKPLLNENELMRLCEEECVIKRTMKRRDLKGNKVDQYPIFNTGETAFKMRYKYMADDFPSGVDLYELPTGDNSMIDLTEYIFDVNAFFANVLNSQEPGQREQSNMREPTDSSGGSAGTIKTTVNIDSYRNSKVLVADLPNGQILLNMIENMLHIPVSDLTVGKAISELDLAEATYTITAQQRDNLLLLLESEVDL